MTINPWGLLESGNKNMRHTMKFQITEADCGCENEGCGCQKSCNCCDGNNPECECECHNN